VNRRSAPVPLRIVVAGVLTVALLGAIGIAKLVGGDSGTSGTSQAPSTSTTATSTSSTPASTSSSPAPTVRLNPAWPAKATSRYSDAEQEAPSTTAPR